MINAFGLKGFGKIEMIMLGLLKDKEVQWDGIALKKMENLKILVIENVCFSRGPSHLLHHSVLLEFQVISMIILIST